MYPVKFRNCAIPANSIGVFFDDEFTRNFFRNPAKFHLAHAPSVNVKETEKEFTLELAAPGLEKSDFNIDVKDELLTISAEKNNENKTEGTKYSRREWSYSNFRRSFAIPEEVNAENISATYNNGILSVVLPKLEEAAAKEKRQIVVS